MAHPETLFDTLLRGGEAAIDELILQRASEELYLDFKRSARNGQGDHLHSDDRENLAKAVSGFGNTAGGVIVWGVDARDVAGDGDLARLKVPIENATRFRSWLEGAVRRTSKFGTA